ncbi:MAG: hypothetical protein CVV42_15130 [Candidatus Riflebacteria bacterium HGW-Riflebacteria-2]|jgi:VIT1/CCC1 family predicted Fe2+/Mn2+ transporter|nr:MAG: hypothetical protein CVV42_15130 [Candidatus Riflebacteria bacterium HGW-Riflebacteria-2]
MLRIVVLIFYFYVVISNEMTFADDDLLFVLAMMSLLMPGMAIGLYYMRAESGGNNSLLQLAGKAKEASAEELAEFKQKYLVARESLYAAGMFFWLSLVLVIAKERYLVSSNNLDYQLTLAVMIPAMCLSVYEDVLQLVLKIKAGMRTSLPIEYDLWLSWFNFSILGTLVVMHVFPYYDSAVGFAIFSAVVLASILYATGAYISRYRKAREIGEKA